MISDEIADKYNTLRLEFNCEEGNASEVNKILNSISDPEKQSQIDSGNCLILASTHGHEEVVKLLLSYNADRFKVLNVKDSDVSLSHYLDVELGVTEAGEPDPAPLRSYEQVWMRLRRKYREDCREHERHHGMGKSQSD